MQVRNAVTGCQILYLLHTSNSCVSDVFSQNFPILMARWTVRCYLFFIDVLSHFSYFDDVLLDNSIPFHFMFNISVHIPDANSSDWSPN
jgi:hypothetical protein